MYREINVLNEPLPFVLGGTNNYIFENPYYDVDMVSYKILPYNSTFVFKVGCYGGYEHYKYDNYFTVFDEYRTVEYCGSDVVLCTPVIVGNGRKLLTFT